jgi:DNA-directed RNA polymerase subunit alpha
MITFEKPNMQIDQYDVTDNYGRFTIEPLERGFGITLGNALRRVLLSSLPGVAITGVQIQGVMHEFATVDGVVEDVTTIVLNLKNVIFKMQGNEPTTVEIHADEEGVVTAGDIELGSANLEVVNKDQVIATLAPGGKLDVKMTVKKGRGYVRSEYNKDEDQALGVIPIDSIYTPVQAVDYNVDTRISRDKTFDRLNLEVRTNGSMSPISAIALASKILSQHLDELVNLDEDAILTNFLHESEKPENEKIIDINIEDLDLSVRSYNSLKRAGIHTLQTLLTYSYEDMTKIRNLGKKSLKEIEERLASKGYAFHRD